MADVIAIIDEPTLTSYLGLSGTPVPADPTLLLTLTNGLVTDAWAGGTPDDIPTWVKTIALEVAARTARNPKGLASWTRSIQDASRTERLADTAARAGVYLTDDERIRLGGKRARRSRFGVIRLRPDHTVSRWNGWGC